MITSWMLYLVFVLDSIITTSALLGAIFSGIGMCSLITNIVYPDNDLRIHTKKIGISAVILIFISIFTPTTKQAAII
jgi:hypothetical protein